MSDKEKIEALQTLKKQTRKSAKENHLFGLCGEIDSIGTRAEYNPFTGKDNRKYAKMREYLHSLVEGERVYQKRAKDTTSYLWPVKELTPRIKWIDKQIKLLQNGEL